MAVVDYLNCEAGALGIYSLGEVSFFAHFSGAQSIAHVLRVSLVHMQGDAQSTSGSHGAHQIWHESGRMDCVHVRENRAAQTGDLHHDILEWSLLLL